MFIIKFPYFKGNLLMNNLFQHFEVLWHKILPPDLKTFVHFFFTHPLVDLAVADCGILREFFNSFDQNTDGKYIRWFWNSLNISLRILFGCAVAYFFIRIPDFLKNYAAICFCLLENLRRCHQNYSKTQTTAEFL